MNNAAAAQMSAVSAALRMLLSGKQLGKPHDLLILASTEATAPLIEIMKSLAAEKRSTFLALFHVEGDTALLERVMIVDGSTRKNEINIGGGKFIRKADGSFAVRSIDRSEPYEYSFIRGGRRLERRAVSDDSNSAVLEMRGLQALITKAGTAACQAEIVTATISCW